MKYKFLLLTSLLVLIFSSCKNIEQNTPLSETTTVTFAADNTRSIYSKLSNFEYTYTIRGKAKSGATFQTDRHYTYNELSYTRFEIQKGTWDFTMNVFTGEEVIFTGTKSVTIDKSSVISIPFSATTGSTASLSVKLNFPQDKGVAKITAGLYDSVTEADAGSELILKAGYVTYTNNDVPAGTNKILKFYFYDCQDVCIASYIEGVYLAPHDNISVERTLSNVNTFAATVFVKDVNGDDVIDSGLLVKAVQDDKEYPMTAVSGTNIYTASLPVGTYDVYAGSIDTDIDLAVEFLQGGNATVIFVTKETLISAIAGLTEDSTIIMAGELTDSDLTVIADAIKNSTYNVSINLSLTTGLTSIPDSAFSDCSKLSGITIPDSVTSIDTAAFAGCTNLTTFTVDSNNANYSGIDGVLFNKDATALITYPAGKQSATYTIPDSVTSIANSAFEKCTSLSSVTIPDSVTSIGDSAFSGCTSLSSVSIGDSVTSIGPYAFRECTSLSSVRIPDSVTSIGDYTFYRCTSLSSVTIPESVTSISSSAFSGCSSLSSVTFNCPITSHITQGFVDDVHDYVNILNSVNIGESVTSIDKDAFISCSNLESINVDSNNANYTSIDGVLFNKDETTLILYPIGKQSAEYTIPDSVTSIGSSAFYSCKSLSSVTIGDSVTSIGRQAFVDCSSLSSVTIPDSVTSIGEYAFAYCTALSSITIGDSVTSLGESAFLGCNFLSSVTIGDSVTSIGRQAFSDCFNLTSISFIDTTTWYRTNNSTNWINKTDGTLTDVSDAAANATYFTDNSSYYWYKL